MTEPADLSNAFGTSAAALANRLARRASPAPPAPPTSPPVSEPPVSEPGASAQADARVDEPPPRQATAASVDRPATPKRAPKKAPHRTPTPSAPTTVDLTAGSTVQVSVYLLPAALQAVRNRVRETRRTNADIAFAAIDATHEQLNDLVAHRRTVPREDGSLFPSRVRHRATADGDRRILWSMQATPGELQIIDRLVTETGAASRSELISVAIEADLL